MQHVCIAVSKHRPRGPCCGQPGLLASYAPSRPTPFGVPVSSGGKFPSALAFNEAGDRLCFLNGGAVADDASERANTPTTYKESHTPLVSESFLVFHVKLVGACFGLWRQSSCLAVSSLNAIPFHLSLRNADRVHRHKAASVERC
ncbi:hypothetical protein C8Q74DRAFT_1247291 [Fomes fomentarius]|nr:hypothetical protein C8Q74DRAFT_1247291 [Fomes fomentarius]